MAARRAFKKKANYKSKFGKGRAAKVTKIKHRKNKHKACG